MAADYPTAYSDQVLQHLEQSLKYEDIYGRPLSASTGSSLRSCSTPNYYPTSCYNPRFWSSEMVGKNSVTQSQSDFLTTRHQLFLLERQFEIMDSLFNAMKDVLLVQGVTQTLQHSQYSMMQKQYRLMARQLELMRAVRDRLNRELERDRQLQVSFAQAWVNSHCRYNGLGNWT